MRRLAAIVLAAGIAAGAAGCGSSPEDKARERGKDIGAALSDLRSARTPGDAGAALDEITVHVRAVRGELPDTFGDELQSIGDGLRATIEGGDRAQILVGLQSALIELRGLSSDTNSVVNELRRGVREGYEDARS